MGSKSENCYFMTSDFSKLGLKDDIVKAMKSAKDEVKDRRNAELDSLAKDTDEAGVGRYSIDDNPYLTAAREMGKENK